MGEDSCSLRLLRGVDSFSLSDNFRLGPGIMRQSACLVVNPIRLIAMVSFFNCMTVVQLSDLMMALTQRFNSLVGA